MNKVLTLLFSLLLATLHAWERHNNDGFAAQATLSAETISLTEPVKITLTLTAPPGYTVNSQALQDNLLNYGETTSSSWRLINTTQANNTFTYTLEPLAAGKQQLTFRDIVFSAPDKASVTLLSGMLSVIVTAIDANARLAVSDVLPLENKPILAIDADNEQQLEQRAAELPDHNRRIFLDRSFPWHYLVLFPLAIALVFASVRMLLRITRDLAKIKKEPTPTETATEALDTLAKSDLVANGSFEGFYVQLTKILRDYIAARYAIAAPEMTTEEFMQAMATNNSFDGPTRNALNALLAYADQVKFAKEPATSENCATALSYATTFIQAG